MKVVYFLRGVGVGIVFAAIVLFAAYKTNPPKLTNAEIVSKAKQLGMIDGNNQDEEVDKLYESTTQETAVTTQEEMTTEKTATVQKSKKDTTGKAANKKVKKTKNKKVSFTITKGMYSEQAATELARLGVIKDARAFNRYLSDHGYASKLVVGTYQLSSADDYYTIAVRITGR